MDGEVGTPCRDMSFLLLELLSPPIHRVAGQRSVRVLPGFSFSGWGCGLLGCQEATIGNPLCEWSRGVAQGSLPGSRSWDPAPRPRTPPPPGSRTELACHCSGSAEEGSRVWGERAGEGSYLFLSNHHCTERFPGTIEPRRTEFICVSKHPSPLKGKAPVRPLWAAGMLLCGSGRSFLLSFFL